MDSPTYWRANYANCGRTYGQVSDSLRRHRLWYLYNTAARHFDDRPFTIKQLREQVREHLGIRPSRVAIATSLRQFYETHNLSLIIPESSKRDYFKLNTCISPDDPAYMDALKPPQNRRGRPRADMREDPVPAEKRPRGRPRKFPGDPHSSSPHVPGRHNYDTYYHRIRRDLKERVLKLFEDQTLGEILTTEQIADYIEDDTGIRFSKRVTEEAIRRYNDQARPPFLTEVEPHTYLLKDDVP